WRRRGACLHIRALGDERRAGAAGDGGDDVRITEIDPGSLYGRRARGDVGGGLALRRDGVVVLLLADAVAADEDLVALCLRGHRREVGLRFLQHAERAVQRSPVRSRVDLAEPLPRLDIGALAEFALEHDAIDP